MRGQWMKGNFECPYCGIIRRSMSGIYKHLKYEHNLSHDEAYDEAGHIHCQTIAKENPDSVREITLKPM